MDSLLGIVVAFLCRCVELEEEQQVPSLTEEFSSSLRDSCASWFLSIITFCGSCISREGRCPDGPNKFKGEIQVLLRKYEPSITGYMPENARKDRDSLYQCFKTAWHEFDCGVGMERNEKENEKEKEVELSPETVVITSDERSSTKRSFLQAIVAHAGHSSFQGKQPHKRHKADPSPNPNPPIEEDKGSSFVKVFRTQSEWNLIISRSEKARQGIVPSTYTAVDRLLLDAHSQIVAAPSQPLDVPRESVSTALRDASISPPPSIEMETEEMGEKEAESVTIGEKEIERGDLPAPSAVESIEGGLSLSTTVRVVEKEGNVLTVSAQCQTNTFIPLEQDRANVSEVGSSQRECMGLSFQERAGDRLLQAEEKRQLCVLASDQQVASESIPVLEEECAAECEESNVKEEVEEEGEEEEGEEDQHHHNSVSEEDLETASQQVDPDWIGGTLCPSPIEVDALGDAPREHEAVEEESNGDVVMHKARSPVSLYSLETALESADGFITAARECIAKLKEEQHDISTSSLAAGDPLANREKILSVWRESHLLTNTLFELSEHFKKKI